MSLKKISIALFFIGVLFLGSSLGNNSQFISYASVIFMMATFFLGLHLFFSAKKLSKGNVLIEVLYRATPLILPTLVFLVSHFANVFDHILA